MADGNVDLFDIVTKKYIARGVNNGSKINIAAKQAMVIYALPEGTPLKLQDGKIIAGEKTIISYK